MMKRKLLPVFALTASLALGGAFAPLTTTQAATIKLNKTAVTISQGKTYKLKVTGTKTKVKWTSSNKKIATVNSSGTVTAKAVGRATITAKVGKKSLKCKVTVKSVFSPTQAAKNIKYELQDTGDGVVAILKNNNKEAVSINATLVYYNASGKMLKASNDFNYCLEPNQTATLYFIAPYDSDYNTVAYDSYKLSFNVDKSYYTTYAASKIDVVSNMGADNVTAEVINNSNSTLEFINLRIVYYNASGQAIGTEERYAECERPGSSDYISFSLPYNEDYNTIQPASYKIFVNHAYK